MMSTDELRNAVDDFYRKIVSGEVENEYQLKEFSANIDLSSGYGLHVYTNLCVEFGKRKALAVAKKQAETLLYFVERA